MQSVILAGGLGTRLLPYTMFMPKPMLPLGEKPILEHLIEWNAENGINDIILCISYLGRIVEEYFGDGERFDVSIQYAVSRRPLATAGQLKTAEHLINGRFVCMYGDSIYGFNLGDMINEHKKKDAFITMGLHEHRSSMPYGVVDTDESGRVTAWREKPSSTVDINMGCYTMEMDTLKYIPKDKPTGMDAVVNDVMNDNKKVFGYITSGKFFDVGTYSSYKEISQEFRKRLGDI